MNDVYRAVGGLIFFWFVIGVLISALTDWVVLVGTERYAFGGLIILGCLLSLVVGSLTIYPDIIKNWLKGK